MHNTWDMDWSIVLKEAIDSVDLRESADLIDVKTLEWKKSSLMVIDKTKLKRFLHTSWLYKIDTRPKPDFRTILMHNNFFGTSWSLEKKMCGRFRNSFGLERIFWAAPSSRPALRTILMHNSLIWFGGTTLLPKVWIKRLDLGTVEESVFWAAIWCS